MFSTVYLGLGSNIGDRERNLGNAVRKLYSWGKITAFSSIYATEPWGRKDIPEFLNMVLCVESDIKPQKMLEEIRLIENSLGRKRGDKFASRVIDIDILFIGDAIIAETGLEVPHPLLHLRRFVLEPLCEIAPGFSHPKLKKSVKQLLTECPDLGKVTRIKNWGK
jgi:2-amino-4-hydroxy-6-hydroxymethyldihydropteridine diphosphokinase